MCGLGILRFIAGAIEVLDHVVRLIPLFAHLAGPDPAPIYLHCTAGKDCTGRVVMLLFRLAGILKETVAEEYALINLGPGEDGPRLVENLLRSPSLALDEETVKRIVVAKKDYVTGLCDVPEERYGVVERYLKPYLKMSTADVQAIKSALIVVERPIFKKEKKTEKIGKATLSFSVAKPG
ncbi:MAG: hypothetical protein Q9184_000697 [Pyrenodesmia sp. 2 TL-2023]